MPSWHACNDDSLQSSELNWSSLYPPLQVGCRKQSIPNRPVEWWGVGLWFGGGFYCASPIIILFLLPCVFPPRTVCFGLWILQSNPHPDVQGGSEPAEVKQSLPLQDQSHKYPDTQQNFTALSFGFRARHANLALESDPKHSQKKKKKRQKMFWNSRLNCKLTTI